MTTGKIYGVALGPGDPELITLKGLNILKKVERIYFPGSISKKGIKSSHSLKIMQPHNLSGDKMRGIYLPMSMERQQTELIYSQTFEQIHKDYKEGLQIAIVSEGDISFYSTFAYLLEYINEFKLDFEMIAGIPAFIMAGAANKFPLALQSDKVLVVSQLNDLYKLARYVEEFETVVIMKLSTVKNHICSFIQDKNLNFFYGEYLGTDQQYMTSNIEDLKSREIPYFSVMIFNKYVGMPNSQ